MTAMPTWVRKEVRALLPPWIGAMCAALAALLFHGTDLFGAAALASAFCIVALGAQSFGQEYTLRTLPLLLSQPVGRGRLYLVKYGVAAPMILSAALAAWMSGVDELWRRPPHVEVPLLFLATTGALAVAPFLTLLSRGTLPGLVFTIAVPGLVLLVGTLAGALVYGAGRQLAVNAFVAAFLWWGMWAIAAGCLISSWFAFRRLEAVEGAGEQLEVRFLEAKTRGGNDASAAGRRRSVWRVLIAKELRLQQMTFVVMAIYVVGVVALASAQKLLSNALHPEGIIALSALYSVLLAVLIGSLAAAEERQFGTHAANLLLPIPRWKAWALKAGVAFGLALVLGILLPTILVLASFRVFGWDAGLTARVLIPQIPAVMLATSASLYVSSFSSSGVRAAVVSFPFMFSSAAVFLVVQSPVLRLSYRIFPSPGRNTLKPGQSIAALEDIMLATGAAAILSVIATLLFLSYVNYRSEERSTSRIALQAVLIAAHLTLIGTVLTLLPPLYFTTAP